MDFFFFYQSTLLFHTKIRLIILCFYSHSTATDCDRVRVHWWPLTDQSLTPPPGGLGWWTVAKCHLHCHRDMVEMCQNLIKQTITRGSGSQLSYKPYYSISLIKSCGVLLILIKPLRVGQNLTNNNELYGTSGEGTWRTKGSEGHFLNQET